MSPDAATTIVNDTLVAATGVVVLFYAWRGLGHLPIVARLMTGLALGVTVLGAFALVLLTFGAGGRAFVREPRMPWSGDVVAAAPSSPPKASRSPDATAVPAEAMTVPAEAAAPEETTSETRDGRAEDRRTARATAERTAPHAEQSSPVKPAPSPSDPPAVVAAEQAPAETAVATLSDAATPAAAPDLGHAPAAPAAAQSRQQIVLFATDRASDSGDPRRFGSGRGDRLSLGRARFEAPSGATGTASAALPTSSAGGAEASVSIETADGERWAEMAVKEAARGGSGRRALVYVHGYNTSLEVALARAARVARDVHFEGLVLVYSWPSLGRIPSYSYDVASARRSATFLREFLTGPLARCGVTSVNILGEGIGAEPVLAALADLGAERRAGLKLDQVMLAAPDLDASRLGQLIGKIGDGVGGLTLYAAAETRALAVSRRFHGGQPRAGDIAAGEPVVLPGIDSIDVSAAGGDLLAVGGEEEMSGATVRDIAAVLDPHSRPADQRTALQRVAARGGGHYWRLAR